MSLGDIRVLVVDDSAFMRRMVGALIDAAPEFTVAGYARNGVEAVEKVVELQPDVVTLDVEMPGMDGLEALQKIMAKRPTPVVMVSSLTQEGADITIKCLQMGAVDFVGKPSGSISLGIEQIAPDLIEKLKTAAESGRPRSKARTNLQPAPLKAHPVECVFIGTSTGGPRALHSVLTKLPGNLGVPVVVVQHMPAGFTLALANRLNAESPLEIREAKTYDRLEPNQVLIAPGGFHTEIGRGKIVRIVDTPPVNCVRPAVDVTLDSLTEQYGAGLMGVLLTGMGRDGAASLKRVREKGGRTLVESEETCVVYGMPRAAVEIGAAEQIMPLHAIAGEIIRAVKPQSASYLGGR
jgi:two-component system chemotaxis response regulator CheB